LSTQEDTRARRASRASAARAGNAAPATAPATVKAAAALAVLAALVTIGNAVTALTDGKSLLHSMATDAVNQLTGGQSAGLDLGSMVDDAVNTEYGTLQARAYVGFVLALGYLALFLPIARGARKLRVVATLVAAAAVIMALIDAKDQTPSLLHTFDIAEMVCAALLVVALWLPASNAYVKARRDQG
jgi:hypothetical protein